MSMRIYGTNRNGKAEFKSIEFRWKRRWLQ